MHKDAVRERRLGTFFIPEELINDCPAKLKIFLSRFLIVRADYKYEYQAIEYLAFNDWFHPTWNGYVPMHYEVVVKRNKNQTVRSIHLLVRDVNNKDITI